MGRVGGAGPDASEETAMQTLACPSTERLRCYAEGRLDEPTHAGIDDHLDACPLCQRQVETLEGQSSGLFGYLRRPALGSTAPDPLLQRLVGLARGLGSTAPAAPGRGVDSFLAEGLVLGQYVLLEPLGAGGMGRVFKARHRRLNKLVAVKVLAPDLLRCAEARARFRREAEAVARLASPHIVAALDASEERGRDFLVMEYVEGVNLADHVRAHGPLSVERALNLTLQAARGLEQAHAAGVVHRDVKPANLLLDASGTVKLLDLGLARLASPGDVAPELTGAGVLMGTAAFMAPEQAADGRRADARADVYSLGCTLFYLLTGRPPYEEPTALETLFAHRTSPVPSLRSLRPDCPPAVEDLLRRMLAKAPEDRPASMHAVVARLEYLEATGGANPVRRRGRRLAAVAALLALAGLVWAVVPGSAERQAKAGKEKTSARREVASPGPAPAQRPPVIEMVQIEEGEFLRGSPADDRDAAADEKPQVKVKISQPFYLGKYKITQGQYEAVMDKNPSAFSAGGRFKAKVAGLDTRDYPVESLSWLDAVRFCNRLSERHRLMPYYKIEASTVTVRAGSNGYRLPTEAEWEYACRAGSASRWSFGNDAAHLGEYAWYAGNSRDTTHRVGTRKPNAWGLYDMHGNVPEWCWDRYSANYYRRSPVSDPSGPGEGATRVFRGGGWNMAAAQTRSAARDSLRVGYSVLTIVGLRVARNAEQ
jgi:formylglycine-generating enzyme required for sulfatase activity